MFFPILLIVFGLVFIGLGILRMRNPEFGWYFSEGWKYKEDVGPSDSYLMWAFFGGIIGIVSGVFFIIFGTLRLLQEILTT